jgi:hypothetical protein
MRAYVRERFRPLVFGPLAIVLAGAASGGRWNANQLAVDAGFALLLLAQFRLWDDLADRTRDAVSHPQRVIVSAPSVRPFAAACIALAALNIAIALARDGGLSLVLLCALDAALWVWYARRGRRSNLGDHLLLAKYPAFVLVLAGVRLASSPLPVGLCAAAIYLCANLYEAWHDGASPAARVPLLLACETALLVATLAAFAFGGHS